MQRQANAIRVRVVSDVNCPWCWAGKRSLETAAAAIGVPVEVTWHPFMLYPDLPAKGVDRSTNLEKKFGPSFRDIMDDMFTRMNRYGVEAKLVPGSRTANTLNAHRLLHYTLTHYSPQLQNQVAEVLFRKVHNEGRFVGDDDELYAAAEEAGFTPSQIQELRTYLDSDQDRDLIMMEDEANKQKGIHSVPNFQFEGVPGGLGGQPPEAFERILRQLSQPQP